MPKGNEENLTLEEVKKIKWRKLNIEELEKEIPEVHRTMELLEEAQKVSVKTRTTPMGV